MEINQSIILITSAGSVLGQTLAQHFIALGAKVLVCDADLQALKGTYNNCKPQDNPIEYFHIKDNDSQTIHRIYDYSQLQFDDIPDVLVNNWLSSPMPLLSNNAGDLNHINHPFIDQLATMAKGLFHFGQIGAERMLLNNKKGVIINVISHEDHHNLSGVENATSMVTGFTHSWAKELSPFNIRVGGVIPALTNTDTHVEPSHWAEIQDELIRSTEYIVSNEYFNGRVVTAEI
ncbi:short-chain dehydrogenase [Vibrio sp. 10N.286.49.B3]|uniref:SDR family oxidoreductase n=1 Tax=Vibrio sp. 10N.286.49.B3 TaxID=1880855 RepID=UPI000C8379FF|nr:SDR family oxidoreductase [Vibrio sp. 10N.286.49.B3]PMH39382.1 short-chain dehydrogenase [Vibrio sp. 10N.286.49.B3]